VEIVHDDGGRGVHSGRRSAWGVVLIAALAILAIVAIEYMALSHGIDGAVLKSSFAVIGGIAVRSYYKHRERKRKRDAIRTESDAARARID